MPSQDSDALFGADEPVFSVSEFVAVLNQTLEYAYPSVIVTGELANFKVSKGRWVYFDLKDETASVRCFGTVYQLSGPLEDGMMLAVRGVPRLHAQYGFSVSVQSIQPVGEGSIKKAAALLEAKLKAEGLFDLERKRMLPYPPRRIGLIASTESAAYRDFMKIIAARWGGIDITVIDVQVQGEVSSAQVTAAIATFNMQADPVDVLVITRGGGSPEDLMAFSTEQVTRAVAASRIPTLVAIGHEIDISLAELAADQRASTPSNAAELLVPDRQSMLASLREERERLLRDVERHVAEARASLMAVHEGLHDTVGRTMQQAQQTITLRRQLLEAFNPQAALARGYSLVRLDGKLLQTGESLRVGKTVTIQMADAEIAAEVKRITPLKEKQHA